MIPRNESTLSSQPDEILKKIIGCQPSLIMNLSVQCKRFYTLFNDERSSVLKILREMLSNAALGHWEKVVSICKMLPDFLLCRGTIYHPNRTYEQGKDPVDIPDDRHPGRYKYHHTVWQIALMNEEYEIAEELARYMDKEEKQKQFEEIFPEREIKCYMDSKKAKKLIKNLLVEVMKDEAITQTDLGIMSNSTQNALFDLYHFVKPKGTHQKGLVFDTTIYWEAIKLFDNERLNFKSNSDTLSFWNIRVEEYLASLLGTHQLRHHAQGLFTFDKTMRCHLSDNSSIFPFQRGDSIPGFHFFVCPDGSMSRSVRYGSGGQTINYLIQERINKKNQFLHQYINEVAIAPYLQTGLISRLQARIVSNMIKGI